MSSQRQANGAVQNVARPAATGDVLRNDMSKRRWTGYIIAVLAVSVLFGLRWILEPFLKGSSAFLFFAPAVMVCAWYGGRGPGLVATLLGAVAANILTLPPSGEF